MILKEGAIVTGLGFSRLGTDDGMTVGQGGQIVKCELSFAPAAVAKSDLAAAVGVKGAPVVALSAAVPIAIAHCIEPVELKADLEMAAGSEV